LINGGLTSTGKHFIHFEDDNKINSIKDMSRNKEEHGKSGKRLLNVTGKGMEISVGTYYGPRSGL